MKPKNLRHSLSHSVKVLRPESQPIVWPWMFLCAMTTTMPLIVGFVRGELPWAIYGALTGYLISLNDQGGRNFERIWIATLSTLGLYAGLRIGWLGQTNPVLFDVTAALLLYAMGLLAGRGGEIERLLLFALVIMFVARFALNAPAGTLEAIGLYIAIAFATLLAGLIPFILWSVKARPPAASLRSAGKILRQSSLAHHGFALTITLAVLSSAEYVEYFHVPRGYWTVITTLLVLKPDRSESARRIFQRVFGTVAGVVTGEGILLAAPRPLVLIIGVFICAGSVPFVWLRNYWLVTFAATNLVIMLLSLAAKGHFEESISLLRLSATLRGCAIGATFLLLARVTEFGLKPNAKASVDSSPPRL